MKCQNLWALCLCLMGAVFNLSSTAQEKYSKVKIPVSNPQIKKFVFDRLEIDHYQQDHNTVTVVLDSDELNTLVQSHYPYELLVDDMVQHTYEQNRYTTPEESFRAPVQGTGAQKIASIIQTPAGFGTGGSLRLGAAAGNPGYFTYAEMTTIMQNLATNNPTLVQFFSIGNTAVSADGTAAMPIYGVKISDNVTIDENEGEVLFTALQHAREAIGGTSMIFFMQYLVANYNNPDNVIKNLVNNREIYIIPCLNPQGYSFNYGGSSASYPVTGGGLWRKNRRFTGGSASNIGVDINRNYLIDWGNCAGASASCGTTTKTADTYYGPSVFSEPETQAMRTFVQGRRFTAAIDQHAFGPYYSLPYGRPSLHPVMNHQDSAFYTYIPALMGMYNGHRAGNSPETVNYEVAGGIKDWLLMGDIGVGTKGKVCGMTGEAGGGDFWAPIAQIVQLCKENCFQNLQLAYSAGSYYDVQDMTPMEIVPPVGVTTGNVSCTIRRIGLGTDPVTVTLIPLQNMLTPSQPVTRTLANYYDTAVVTMQYNITALGAVAGKKIRYVWKVESGGIAVYDTVIKFFRPTVLLTDDMEGTLSDNWNTSITPTGPNGWTYVSNISYNGSKSLTESPDGNYTTSSTRTITTKTAFSLLDAQEAYLSFWVRHRAENFRDRLHVQVSTDGGTVWSTPLSGSTTVMEDNTTNQGSLGGLPALTGIRDNWTREIYSLSAFKLFNNVMVRFRFISDADASNFDFELDDGFYIDDLTILKTTINTPLPVSFIDFHGKLLSNNTVQLNLEAVTDAQHDHFEIEKSTDANSNFSFMAKVATVQAFPAFDYTPTPGNNYYRVKQVDKDGTVNYSKTIKIFYSRGKLNTSLFPNPVSDNLTVQITDLPEKDEYIFSITDVVGRGVTQITKQVNVGTNYVKLNLEKLPAGLYMLKIINSKNEVMNIDKFIKK